MPFIVEKHKLAFFGLPKVASTSIKHALYELENGKEFDRHNHGGRHVHELYPTTPFSAEHIQRTEGMWRFAVVRDPIKRMLSAYSNRVEHHRDLEKPMPLHRQLKVFGLNKKPSKDEFFCNIHKYRRFGSIKHHTEATKTFLGPDQQLYDAIYRVEELSKLAEDLSERCNTSVVFGRFQTGGTKLRFEDLSEKAQRKLIEFTKPEYEYLSGIYTAPAVSPQPVTQR